MNNNINRAIKVFKEGGIVIFPTDTAYGIGCRMDNPDSVRRIFKIKKRSPDNAFLVLVNNLEMAEKYVSFDNRSSMFVKERWPGPITVILPCKEGKVLGIVTGNSSVLAVRWPDHKIMEHVIREVGVPIIATSANISGEPTPYNLEDVNKTILDQVDFVLDGECTYKKESTIIDAAVIPWKVIREGAVQLEISNI